MSRLFFSVFAVACLSGTALAQSPHTQATNPLINYPGFLELSEEVMTYRNDRLLSAEQWFELAQRDDVLILDTRSRAAYEMGHLAGAVHLNFSDFTSEKLAKVIGDTDRIVLIYCNNNFDVDMPPLPLKRIELALNIPTFINLYGYGYKNIYELNDVLSLNDPRVEMAYDPQFEELWRRE